MTAQKTDQPRYQVTRMAGIVMADIIQGLMKITHSGAAMLGLGTAVILVTLMARPDLRQQAEHHALGWLLQRQESQTQEMAAIPVEPQAAERATAALPHTLPVEQAKVAHWLSRKYRVAPEPLSVLVAEAFEIGRAVKLDPTLILAVMAIESRFNPFAQSPVGAQGLMQVLTRVHTDKYEDFGGKLAAFDPVANLRVGAKVLQDCIRRAGSVEGGLRLYVGAVTSDGADYINKVMAEHLRIQSVALGKPMPTYFPNFAPAPIPVSDPDATDSTPGGQQEQEALAPAVPATGPAGGGILPLQAS
jgi:Transglycosylase SLT domain